MSFTRHGADRWHREVPGARWFKADLHVHTIDDRAGKRAKMPDGLSDSPEDPEVLGRYAKHFLRGVVAAGVQVLGLTPHSPRVGTTPETSAVWKIVEEWNSGCDDDGIPFRDKIYAVFPGFEPSLKDGQEGLHLLFLFDPEIGRDNYLKLFDLVMGAVIPWQDGQLQISTKTGEDVFEALGQFRERECREDSNGSRPWGHLVLAPHVDAPKGLFGAKHKQVLQFFDHGEVAGLELSDDKLPSDQCQGRDWLAPAMKKHRQAFFHGSDAYTTAEIGRRYTWIKLASPRIEALRQSFIASDSRMRIGFVRAQNGQLEPIADPPDVTLSQRPWLKCITIQGEASFFGAGKGEEMRFDLSPDLTCLIGGSMTGKSTLLDGLRTHVQAPPPADSDIRARAEGARDRLLAGAACVELECPGSDPTAALHEQWPAVFYAQNELQRLAGETGAVEEILGRLVATEVQAIEKRRRRLKELDEELSRSAKRLAELDEQAGDAEQAYERAKRAKTELSAFAEAGVESLHQAVRARGSWQEQKQKGAGLRRDLDALIASAAEIDLPEIDADLAAALGAGRDELTVATLHERWARMVDNLQVAKRDLDAWVEEAGLVCAAAAMRERDLQEHVERVLAERGFDASRLREFQALNQQASLLASYEANLKESRARLTKAEKAFTRMQEERTRELCDQRAAFDSVMESIHLEFGGRIRASREDCGNSEPLDRFLQALTQKGITRWWNGVDGDKPSPQALARALDEGSLSALGMTDAVEKTFRETITAAKKRELEALRCPDRYRIELELGDGSYRPLDELSGGQRVSVLLSLLLETTDERPLVIDQPEDELDNRFLFETVLPALKKLKGRRQVIVATHNANIVVNGDADMVIQLEATAKHGQIAAAGAIEEPTVRDAIVRTVDGGAEAFRLRRLKYGF